MTPHIRAVSSLEGYAIWAPFYDQERNPLIMTEEPLVRELLETLPPPSTVLDVATGTGRWAIYLARHGARVTAIDQSPEMLAVAREKARAERLSITFEQRDMQNGIPFPSANFDFVIRALALSHFVDLRSVVLECGRVLEPGGYLLITDFHPQAIRNGWNPRIDVGEGQYILPHPQHDRSDYLDAVEASGCEIMYVREVLVREQPPGSILVDDVESFLRDYGDWPMCLIVLATRSGAS